MVRPERSADRTLRLGLISDAESLSRMLDAVRACPDARPVAISAEHPQTIPEGAEWCNDARSMVVEGQIDAVLIAASTRLTTEIAEIAATHGLPVWRRPPVALTFGEAAETARRQQDRKSTYRVSSWWEHVSEDYAHAVEALEAFSPLLIHIDIHAPAPSESSWRRRAPESGGGALVNSAYDATEMLAALRGLPDRVWAAATRIHGPSGGRDVEDACFATLAYADGGLASVRVTWGIEPYGCWMRLYDGVARSVEFARDEVRLRAPGLAKPPGFAFSSDNLNTEIARFIAAVRGGQSLPDTFDRHLAALALVETIYLATRTGQPEDPRKLYEIQAALKAPAL